jgi:hypothetical protein
VVGTGKEPIHLQACKCSRRLTPVGLAPTDHASLRWTHRLSGPIPAQWPIGAHYPTGPCGYILLTCDRDYLDNRKFPLIHCPAIVVFDFGKGTPREILAALQCLRMAFRIPQFYDKWMKIEAAKDSWIETARFLNGTTARTRYRWFRGKLQEWTEQSADV